MPKVNFETSPPLFVPPQEHTNESDLITTRLGSDLQRRVISFLPLKSQAALSLVSKHWHQLVVEEVQRDEFLRIKTLANFLGQRLPPQIDAKKMAAFELLRTRELVVASTRFATIKQRLLSDLDTILTTLENLTLEEFPNLELESQVAPPKLPSFFENFFALAQLYEQEKLTAADPTKSQEDLSRVQLEICRKLIKSHQSAKALAIADKIATDLPQQKAYFEIQQHLTTTQHFAKALKLIDKLTIDVYRATAIRLLSTESINNNQGNFALAVAQKENTPDSREFLIARFVESGYVEQALQLIQTFHGLSLSENKQWQQQSYLKISQQLQASIKDNFPPAQKISLLLQAAAVAHGFVSSVDKRDDEYLKICETLAKLRAGREALKVAIRIEQKDLFKRTLQNCAWVIPVEAIEVLQRYLAKHNATSKSLLSWRDETLRMIIFIWSTNVETIEEKEATQAQDLIKSLPNSKDRAAVLRQLSKIKRK